MATFFSKLFSKKTSSVIGVDIGASAIKIVQCTEKDGVAVLDTYGSIALGPYADQTVGRATNLTEEKIKEALRDLLREAKVTTKKGGFSIPLASSLVSTIELPDVDDKQLATMIPIEARKYIPVPISEVILDWSIIPDDTHSQKEKKNNKIAPVFNKVSVLLVAIHKEVLTRQKNIIDGVGLNSMFFELEIFGAMRAVLGVEEGPVMIFDFGSASTKLYVSERGAIKMSHTINRGSQDCTTAISRAVSVSDEDAELIKRREGLGSSDKDVVATITSSLEYIFSETKRVLLNYERKYNKPVAKIVLVGGGSVLQGFASLAQKTFTNIQVVSGSAFSNIKTPAFLEKTLEQTGPEFAVAAGAVLRAIEEQY